MISRQSKIYLCSTSLQLINVLNGVKTEGVELHQQVKDYDELTFEVDKYVMVDGERVPSNCYDMLDVYMYLYLENVGYFQMQMPEVRNEGQNETKSIVAYSIEKEFEDKDWLGLEINTGLEGSYEMIADDNVDDLGFAKDYVFLYRPDKPQLSFLHILINEKMPMWSVRDEDIDRLSWNKKMSISEDNVNCYALLTSVIGPKLEVIFMFDTMNRRIKVIDKASLNRSEYDTNIYIGMRNLMNSEDFNIDEGSVFTRFNVRGEDDLNVRDYNYDEERIVDLSYFMNTKYMTPELIQKIASWLVWRDEHREEYAGYAQQLADINDKIYEITYRMPNDATYVKQYTNMDDELLQENLTYFNAQITALQISVDPERAPASGDPKDYVPRVDGQGKVDHQWYLDHLYEKANGYGGYYTYLQIEEYILPNIQIAIDNKGKIPEERDEYNEDFEHIWELFGIKELERKATEYEQEMTLLKDYKKSWSQLTPQEKASYVGGESQYSIKHDRYAEIAGWLGTEDTTDSLLQTLKNLRDEVADLEEQYDDINDSYRIPMTEKAKLNNEFWGLTTQEWYVVNRLFHDTDYQNQNILITSIDNAVSRVDREKELYEDAVSKLSEVAQPQIHYNISTDNFIYIPEFAGWKDDLKLLNFIRVGIHDNYAVKLRVIGYRYNPCEIDPNLQLEFSNFISSKSGRDDLTNIIGNENNRGSKNSISIGTGNSETDRQYMTTLLQMMTQTQLFNAAVTGVVSGQSLDLDSGRIMNLISQVINVSELDAGHLKATKADFDRLWAGYIDSDFITTELLNATEAQISDILTIGTDTITTIAEGTITTENVVASLVAGQTGDFNQLTAATAFMDYLSTNLVVASEIRVDDLIAKMATIDVAEIERLYAGNAFVGSLQTLSSTTATSVINDAYIYNAVANKISVADLAAGDITISNSARILSENGALVMNGTALQILGTDSQGHSYVGVQLGYDTSSNPSLILRNEDGEVVLSPSGITAEAIADQLIQNNMIKTGTISEDRLSFNVMKQGDEVAIEQITMGGGSFGVEYTTFKNGTNAALDDLQQEIEDSAVYSVYITSSNGSYLSGGNTTLSARLFKNSVDVTDQWDSSAFHWTRKSKDAAGDIAWNNAHSTGSKSITITGNDVTVEADFTCRFETTSG